MANIRRRKYQRVPEKVNESVTPKGIFISNEYKNRILAGFILVVLLAYVEGLLTGLLFKDK
ncbi:hypothetical protein [Anaeropeptidivorans aminofermentans]|jgi:hypothetical protein|uniref:hypothetical protein n=1 Tax=Anaeropeptidivorans aminofermentans TaxID=2934315 RepID=UPI0020256040|nr:hypothetical protein [Anaeropeptidivorans aminofermentans]MBE6013410.1 hypothetical protein [Lachnospiraceae bacterium]